ncbi:tyrosine-type recombinase/integrase [Bacillus sp. ISL-7]|uniref:tyrosine-type recombinase/integrase n=1 Tax=Bacillus sp. ISL-7 TaxID=2819136 RepID=UPI001BE8D821|nr:tyrosine-type recombinase/integrase [Bacillus sp. ISL-7]MBT2738114.1 tyrosine-type recombinase/integrase [Bacillus sp. ISL-7]
MVKTKQNKKDEIKDVQPIRTLEGIEDMKWALKRHCSERDYILFCLGINTGLRISDLLKLKIEEVKGKKSFNVKEGKTDKPRKVLVNGLYEELNTYIETLEGTEWLFPSRKGDKPISRIQAYRQLNKASEFAGVEAIGTHTLRKTFGYWFYKQYKDVASLQDILNHSHPRVTLDYIGITAEEIEDKLLGFNL